MLAETTALELEPNIRWNVTSQDGEVRIMIMLGSQASLLLKPSEANEIAVKLGQAILQADIELGLLTDAKTEENES